MTRNPIAKSVTRIPPQIIPDKRRKIAEEYARREADCEIHTDGSDNTEQTRAP